MLKEHRELIRFIQNRLEGKFKIVYQDKGHPKLHAQIGDKEVSVAVSLSPSCSRYRKNCVAQIRQMLATA